ncbi:MAG: HNH endonuclease [Pseudomonadota bacterium]
MVREAYAKSINHLCEECSRRGYVTPLDDVDHMIPVRLRPDLRLDPENLDGLCRSHHNGFKRRLEKYAERTGQADMLPIWVKQPELRPMRFQIRKYGPMKS